jgi:hypothetical protein
LNGGTERRLLATSEELRTVLEEEIRVTLPEGAELQAALDRVVHRP